MGMPHALVTRPARDAARWVRDLRARGIDAAPLPLIDIHAVREPHLIRALERARAALGQFRAVMFVSGNAVEHFFELNQAPALVSQAWAAINTRAWAPGPGTQQALCAAGVPARCIDAPCAATSAQFDSEALWQVVAGQVRAGDRVLIVRGATGPALEGGNGRGWLAARLADAGAAVDFVAAYERGAPELDACAQALARRAAADGSCCWLFSSSEAIGHLARALPGQSWQAARAIATHPRIADAARAAGFGQVEECRPTLEDVAASIKSHHVV